VSDPAATSRAREVLALLELGAADRAARQVEADRDYDRKCRGGTWAGRRPVCRSEVGPKVAERLVDTWGSAAAAIAHRNEEQDPCVRRVLRTGRTQAQIAEDDARVEADRAGLARKGEGPSVTEMWSAMVRNREAAMGGEEVGDERSGASEAGDHAGHGGRVRRGGSRGQVLPAATDAGVLTDARKEVEHVDHQVAGGSVPVLHGARLERQAAGRSEAQEPQGREDGAGGAAQSDPAAQGRPAGAAAQAAQGVTHAPAPPGSPQGRGERARSDGEAQRDHSEPARLPDREEGGGARRSNPPVVADVPGKAAPVAAPLAPAASGRRADPVRSGEEVSDGPKAKDARARDAGPLLDVQLRAGVVQSVDRDEAAAAKAARLAAAVAAVDVRAPSEARRERETMSDMNEASYEENNTALARRTETAPVAREERPQAPMQPAAQASAQVPMGPRTSAQTDALYLALASAQMEYGKVEKTRNNDHFKSKYANLGDVMEAVLPALKKHQLVPMQIPAGNRLFVRVIHGPSGQWIEGSLQIVPPDQRGGIQALGSALTYTRRYLLTMMLGIVAFDEDDDGNAAQHHRGRAA
jgi:hypothetical protein